MPTVGCANSTAVNDDATIFVVRCVLEFVRAEAAKYRCRETGGALFGYWTSDGNAVITAATGPGPRARHGWVSFEPDTTHCQEQLNEVYQRTTGAITYLGEWHTHPRGRPCPSTRDIATMCDVARDVQSRQARPLLWIIATRLRRKEQHGIWMLNPPKCRCMEISWLDAVPI
jgi:integrative and conjugative element protein (TIGR02256 family)